jgi:N-acetyl-gamma-glutamyl-phosphate reductase
MFATAIQLVLPLAAKGLLKTDVHATTEVLAQESAHQKRHFSWRSNNMSHYKAFDHQHLEKSKCKSITS